MSLNFQLSCFFFYLAVFSLLIPTLSLSSDQPTAFELLPKYGLPRGLLPDSVVSYTLGEDGRFVVKLADSCTVSFDYLVHYDKTISGKLKYGSITDLDGIKVKRFFVWFDVDEIKVDLPPSNSIYFQVGFINKRLDIEQFNTVHSCPRNSQLSGCGSWKQVLELPTPTEEVQMLITE